MNPSSGSGLISVLHSDFSVVSLCDKWSLFWLPCTQANGAQNILMSQKRGDTEGQTLLTSLLTSSRDLKPKNHQPKARQSTFYVEQLATRPDAAMAVLNARLGRRHWQDWKLSRILIINNVFMYQLLQDSIKDIIQSPNGDLEIYESSADCIVLWGKYWR